MSVIEPPRPERGKTAQEAGSDESAGERRVREAKSRPQQALAMMRPGFVLSQADEYPVGIKQFLQFCLILVYPAFVFIGLLYLVVGPLIGPIEWVLLLPFRVLHRKRDPEGYFEMYGRHTL